MRYALLTYAIIGFGVYLGIQDKHAEIRKENSTFAIREDQREADLRKSLFWPYFVGQTLATATVDRSVE